jgi:hypothetical protein
VPAASVAGERVRIPIGAKLADVCLKCGTRAGVSHHDFPFVHFSLRAILLLIATHIRSYWTGRYRIPLCVPCAHRYRSGRLVWKLGPWLAIGTGLISFAAIGLRTPPLLFLACFATPWIAAYLFARPRLIWISAVTTTEVTVSGVHETARAAIAIAAK